MVAPHPVAISLLQRTEVAADGRTAELVVERGGTDRTVEHDLQRGDDAFRLAVVVLPRLLQPGHAQVRHAETDEARLGARAAADGTLVADLATGAGGRAGVRRNRGRVVVRLHLHHDVHWLIMEGEAAGGRVGEEACGPRTADDGGVVRIGAEDVRIGRLLVRVPDHAEQALRLLGAVDGPGGVEDLVPAVLAVRLRKHHELDVGGVAAEAGERVAEIVDLVGGQRKAALHIGLLERRAPAAEDVDGHQRPRRTLLEEPCRVVEPEEDAFHHAVVQVRSHGRALIGRESGRHVHVVGDAALDAPHGGESRVAHDVGGLARPGRERAGPGHHQEEVAAFVHVGSPGAVLEQAFQDAECLGRERRLEVDEVHKSGPKAANASRFTTKASQQALKTEGR